MSPAHSGRSTISRLTTMMLILGAVAVATSPAMAAPRVFRIPGGRVLVDGPPGYETVVVEKKNHRPSQSTCDVRSGTYDELSGFFKKFRAAVKGRRRGEVVALVRFPFRLSSASSKTYADAAELTAHYDEVFTPEVVKRVAGAEPAIIYCSGGAAMLGDGVIWAHTEKGFTGADAVNQ